MTPQEELQVLNNALLFLRRTNLSGEEVMAFNEVMQYIGARHQGLTGAIQSQQKQAADVAETEE